jgi:outer membrane lipoprotein carrier protein
MLRLSRLLSVAALAVSVMSAGVIALPASAGTGATTPSTTAPGTTGTEPTTVDALVAAVQATYKGVNSIRAEFTQTAKNPMTGVEEKQRGRIALARPRKMRVEFGLPVKQAVVSDGATQWLYSADQKQVIVQRDLGGASGVSELIDNLGHLSDLFDVTLLPPASPPKPVHMVTLKPKKAGALKSLELTMTKQKYLLQDLILVDPTDSVTRMTFTGVRMNVVIPDSEFTFTAPPGTAVVQM